MHAQITLMDWGNAIVRSKETDASGAVTAITMELNLEGDFRKTKKKITWLAQPTSEHPLVEATLLDYDYIITKKKLEEGDDVKDFVTPVTEFREDALADANVLELKKGDIIQFERKGYYIFDGIVEGEAGKKWEFINIPDGRASSLASKAGVGAAASAETQGKGKAASRAEDKAADPPAETKMYKVAKIYGEEPPTTEGASKMYEVKSV